MLGAANLNGTGNTSANVMTGNTGANILVGLDGNDTLDGGAGIDRLEGGDGDDTYTIDSASEVLVETLGTDLVRSTVTKTLAAGFENLTLLGTANLNGTGNTSVNVITGNAGDNILDGGTGADTLIGGGGNDTYIIDNTSDVLIETTGIDMIHSPFSRTLAAGFENLTLLGTANLAGSGNTSANVITGNTGANVLLGFGGNDVLRGGNGNDTLDGGVGIDRLEGGFGNDTYTIDSASEFLVELGGTDLVRSTATKTLGTGFENLTLLGTANLGGTGNGTVNTIIGNTGANTLAGLAQNDRLIGNNGNDTLDGGVGIDRLEGGAGNDTYTIDSASDVLVEISGIDLVRSTVTKTLATGFENLTLLAGNINGTGNTVANIITGSTGTNTLLGAAGNDTINGGAGNDTLVGGLGKDTMTGATGADKFDFNLTTESVRGVNRDVILDFIRAQGDKIDLSTIDADTDGTAGNQAFAFIGTGAFTGVDGQLRCSAGIVQGDVNGDRVADFEIKVNLATLLATDFIL